MKKIVDRSDAGWLAHVSDDTPERLLELGWYWERSRGKIVRKSGIKGSRVQRTLDIALHREVMGQLESVAEDPETGLLRALPKYNVVAVNGCYRDCMRANLYLVEADGAGRVDLKVKWQRRREKIAALRKSAEERDAEAEDAVYVLSFVDAWDNLVDRFPPGFQPPKAKVILRNGWIRGCLNGDPLDSRLLNWVDHDPRGHPTRRSAVLNGIDELLVRSRKGDEEAAALLKTVYYGVEGYPVRLGMFAAAAGLLPEGDYLEK